MGFPARFSFFLLIAVISITTALSDEYHCYAEDNHPYLYFAHKTAYQFVRETNNITPVPDCTPVQIWMLARHGARYPDKSTIEKMRNLTAAQEIILKNHESESGSGTLCGGDLEGIRRWKYNLIPEQQNQLTPQGHDDFLQLAKKLKSNFPQVLNSPYSGKKFKFQSTHESRTIESAKAFAEGLFPGQPVRIPPVPSVDRFLNIHHSCPTWEAKVLNNVERKKEAKDFQKSNHFSKVISRVSERLGFKYNLTTDFINLMFEACRYEKARHVTEISPWCAVFTKDELKILEYKDDLSWWYKGGFGELEENAKLGCVIVRDMMTHFDYIVKNGKADAPLGVFRFSHSTLLLLTYTKLRMNEDGNKLTAKNFETMRERKWRTSLIDPFGANLIAVLYECNTGEKFRVVFYINERVADYPGCNAGLCSWSYLRKQLNSAFSCDADFCNKSSKTTISFFSIFLLFLSILFLVK